MDEKKMCNKGKWKQIKLLDENDKMLELKW